MPRRVEFRPRYFKRGDLARLILDYMREHTGETVAVASIMPLVTEGRTLGSVEYKRAAVGAYEALQRSERKGIVSREGEGWKAARWRLTER